MHALQALSRYAWLLAWFALAQPVVAAEPLAGTDPLAVPENVVAVQQQQEFDYFLRRIDEARAARERDWHADLASAERHEQSLAAHRANCCDMLGLPDEKPEASGNQIERLFECPAFRIERVIIPAAAGLRGRGLLFSPKTAGRHAIVIACPDADTWPEHFTGLDSGGTMHVWLAQLLSRDAMVYVPQSVERLADHACCKQLKDADRRKILYRLGYVVGRTVPGLDVKETAAAIDYLSGRAGVDPQRVAIMGIGQGGMTALYAAAVDRRVAAVVVADYFQTRERCWDEPVDRRLPRQLVEFGDAEVAALIAPRPAWIIQVTDSSIEPERVKSEFHRASRFYHGLKAADRLALAGNVARSQIAARAAEVLAGALRLPPPHDDTRMPAVRFPEAQAQAARDRHFEDRLAYLRRLIQTSQERRERKWGLLTCRPSEFPKIQAAMLSQYRSQVGTISVDQTPMRPRTELALVTNKYKAYRVMLDVVPGVEVYGNLLIPRDIPERAAAVICQHGLNGLPEQVTGLGQTADTVYHEFGRHLAEQGYVVFAPLLTHHIRPYKEPDYPRTLNSIVRQAEAAGMNRMAMVVAKTSRVIDFLATLPCVDPKRIGYYGLSYGGYSAIHAASLVDRLAATIVSGNFNDQQAKLTSDGESTSYLFHPYEDPYWWNLLHRFTHPELILMAAPRAVCIEFAENDAITRPKWTASAWRQTTALHDRFGLTRIALAHFDGVHEIHAVQTVDFLDRLLRPARPVGRDYEYTPTSVERLNVGMPLGGGDPFVTQVLDGNPETRIEGSFWIPAGARQFRGMAIKASRDGRPGPMTVRFGSARAKDDLGAVRLACDAALPLWEQWIEFRVSAQPVQGGQTVFYELRADKGAVPEDHYVIYGPRPLGGKDFPDRFGLAYRVLTDRPDDAVHRPGREETFEHVARMLGPYYQDDPAQRLHGPPAEAGETAIDAQWTIHHGEDQDGVLRAAAQDLADFLATHCGLDVRVDARSGGGAPRTVELAIADDELANARTALAAAEADSRLGASSSGDGMPARGGIFTPALIRKKIGLLEDIMERQLADHPGPISSASSR